MEIETRLSRSPLDELNKMLSSSPRYLVEVSIGIQTFGIPTSEPVGHQQIYRTDFGTTPKDLTSRAINVHYYFRVVFI